MKALLPISIIAALFAGSAMAECTAPASGIKVPDGDKATMPEMLAAQAAVKKQNEDVKTYMACMQTDEDAEVAKAGTNLTEDQRVAIHKRYIEPQNAAFDRVKKLTEQFNASLKAYRAKNPPAPK